MAEIIAEIQSRLVVTLLRLRMNACSEMAEMIAEIQEGIRRDAGNNSPRYARLEREAEAEVPLGEGGVARDARLRVLTGLRVPVHTI